MTEGPAVWKITPPLGPGAPYHAWTEPDRDWNEAHPDRGIPYVPPSPTGMPTFEEYQASRQAVAILDAAHTALPALAEVLRLWPFPKVDIEPMRELVKVLNEANAQPPA